MEQPGTPEQIAAVWQNYWQAHSKILGSQPESYLADIVREEMAPQAGVRILEAGSGTGGLSHQLARAGADVVSLDIVPACVRALQKLDPAPGKLHGVVGDLFHCPFPDQTFDAVFNSGVMEHFQPDDLRRGLLEMARVLKNGGKLVCLVPSARGRFYTWGKRVMEQTGTWAFGPEYPQRSLRPYLADSGLELVREYEAGVLHQMWFVRDWRRRIARLLLLPFGERSRLGAALFGGYLLVSTWRKRGNG